MRDFDALSKLYADEYVLVRPDGSVLSKKEVLRDLQEGGLKFPIETQNRIPAEVSSCHRVPTSLAVSVHSFSR